MVGFTGEVCVGRGRLPAAGKSDRRAEVGVEVFGRIWYAYLFFFFLFWGVPIRANLEKILMRRRWQVWMMEETAATALIGDLFLRDRLRRSLMAGLGGVFLMAFETIFLGFKFA